jgi:dyslexia susceptibility 1 candidate gene 1 protein
MLAVKNFTWTDGSDSVVVEVQIPTATTKNVDIFASEFYVKISCPPYLWQADLWSSISEEQSSASVSPGLIKLTLRKVHDGFVSDPSS